MNVESDCHMKVLIAVQIAAITLVFSELAGGPLKDKSGLHGGFAAKSLLSAAGEVPKATLQLSPPLTESIGRGSDDPMLSGRKSS